VSERARTGRLVVRHEARGRGGERPAGSNPVGHASKRSDANPADSELSLSLS